MSTKAIYRAESFWCTVALIKGFLSQQMNLELILSEALVFGKEIKCCWRLFFIISFVFMYSYLSVGAKKQSAACEETQVGFYFLVGAASI